VRVLKLIFLGTGAGRPTLARNVSSIALVFTEHHNRFWLFDAGEGTQQRLLQTGLKLNKLERIFVTHMHGDHVYGLPGLLGSRTYYEGAGKLRLYGPPGLRGYIEGALRYSEAHLNYEVDIAEIEGGPVDIEDAGYTVEAAELNHRVRSFGYRVAESHRPGRLDLAALARLGVPPGPLYGKLRRGEDVTLPGGQTVRSADVVGPPRKGRVVTILGDTSPCESSVRLAKDADLLVHEATFGIGMEEKAAAYGHSTIAQAAATAAEAGARKLIVTHISSRYNDEEVERLVAEVRSVFPNTEAASDLLERSVPRS
jgi:ribonuclease Z